MTPRRDPAPVTTPCGKSSLAAKVPLGSFTATTAQPRLLSTPRRYTLAMNQRIEPHGRSILAAALLGGVLASAGCLVSSSNKTVESGTRVSGATFDTIQIGQTTEAWLIATLGPPTSRTPVENQPGVEILRYDYSRVEQSAGAVFLIFGGRTSRTTTSRAFFEVTNGVVTRYWQEV